MSSVVNIVIFWWVAMLLGALAGVMVGGGRYFLQPVIEAHFTFKDTRGILYLHGVTGFLATISGIIGVAVAKVFAGDGGLDRLVFGINFQQIFSKEHDEQELRILSALAVSIGIAIIGGLLAGLAIKNAKWFYIDEPNFTDHREFYTSADFQTYAVRNKIGKPGKAADTKA